MRPQRPYLFQAMYDWILDNGWTPHLVVNAMETGVEVPQQYVEGGKIVLNLSPSAIQNFSTEGDIISFSARFGGIPQQIFVPIAAAEGLFSKENNQGMLFPYEEFEGSELSAESIEGNSEESGKGSSLSSVPSGSNKPDSKKDGDKKDKSKNRSGLKIVK